MQRMLVVVCCVLARMTCVESGESKSEPPVPIGINVTPPSYANIFRCFEVFGGKGVELTPEGLPRNNGGSSAALRDTENWPASTDDPATWYTLQYEGSGSFTFPGGYFQAATPPAKDLASGVTTQKLKFVPLANPNDGTIRTTVVYAPDQLDDHGFAREPIKAPFLLQPGCSRTDVFSPRYLELVKPFKVLRFMDWMSTNNWQSRPLGNAEGRIWGHIVKPGEWDRESFEIGWLAPKSEKSPRGPVKINATFGGKADSFGGMGCCAPTELIYNVDGFKGYFFGWVRVDDEVGKGNGNVNFEIWLDNEKVFSSGVMHAGDPLKDVDMRVEGHKQLKLVAVNPDDPAGGTAQDHAVWGGVRLHKDVEWGDWHSPDSGVFQQPYVYPFHQWNSGDWEDMVRLANAVERDMWVNPPINCSNDCVKQLACILRDRLHPGLKVYVEYSNEVWNFDSAKWYTHCVGRLKGLTREQQYAARACEIATIFRTQFKNTPRGDETQRIVMVYGGQVWPDWQNKGLAYVQAKLGPPAKFFDCLAIAPYIGTSDTLPKDATVDDVLRGMYQNLASTMVTVKENKDLADAYGLQLVAYEGGSGLTADGPELQRLCTAAEFDTLMEDFYVDYLREWKLSGGALFNHYSYLGGGYMTHWGDWGALPSALDHGSFKWDGILRYEFTPGDANCDGQVTYADFCILRDHFGQGKPFDWDWPTWKSEGFSGNWMRHRETELRQACWWMDGDFNGDNRVDFADFELMRPRLQNLSPTQAEEIEKFDRDHRVPVASRQDVKTTPGQTVTVQLDAPHSGESPRSFTLVGKASHGELDWSKAPQVSYTPKAGYQGIDQFTFQATDGKSVSNTATVRILVEPAVNGTDPAQAIQVVSIPAAADGIAIDGDLADWEKIQPLPAPFMKSNVSSMKLAWRNDGLYGAVRVKDASLHVNTEKPWTGDCIELFLDLKGSRSRSLSATSMQIFLMPQPDKTGACVCHIESLMPMEVLNRELKASWASCPDGYTLEFFLPATGLEPAKMEAGTRLSFNAAINDDGKPIEQLFSDKNQNSGYKNPSTWGTIELKK